MIEAINYKKQIVSATNAKYDPHWCPECKELVFLRKPKNAIPHFYHMRYNEICSLCVDKKEGIAFEKYNFEKELSELKTIYSERWNNAIDNLIQYDGLHLLYGKEWALTPINYYINTHIENITSELFYLFFHIISGVNNLKAFKTLQMLLDFPFFDKENRNFMWDELYRNCNNEEVFEYILTELHPDIFIMYRYYLYMTKEQQKRVIKNKDYEPLSWLYYILSPNNRIEKYSYVIKKYKKQWNDNKYDLFNDLIIYCIEHTRNRLFGNKSAYDDLYQYVKEQKYYVFE
jgi:hypothetical protein